MTVASVTVTDRHFAGPHGDVPVRLYVPTAPSGAGFVWAHGGGFAHGSLDMPEGDAVARGLAARGVTVVCVDYRLAPERAELVEAGLAEARAGVHYPVPSDEVAAAVRWAHTAELPVTAWSLGGASAGGNLALAAALDLIGTPDSPTALMLAYPTLHAVQDAPDAALRARLDADPEADKFAPAQVLAMYSNYVGADATTAPVGAVPGTAGPRQLAALPPVTIVMGDTDELRMSALAFASALAVAGGSVDISTEPGTRHGHLNRPGPAAEHTLDLFARALHHTLVRA